MWKVNHYYNNPANNSEHEFTNRIEAEVEARKIQSDEPNDPQVSTIENTKTGEYGTRRWGKRNIHWLK